MLKIIGRILRLSGKYAGRIKLAFVISFFEGIFTQVPILAVLFILIKLVIGTLENCDAWIAGTVVAASVVLRALSKRLVDGLQSSAGYEIFANERIKLGDHLKRLPMGYFSEGNIGNITAVVTSDLVFIEEHSMSMIARVISVYLSAPISCVIMIALDYRIGIISTITLLAAFIALDRVHQVAKRQTVLKQESQSRLIGAVLEYVKGISVIKAFNMTGKRGEKISREFKEHRDMSIRFEEEFTPPSLRYDSCFAWGIGITVLAACYFTLNQTMKLPFMLMILIFVFQSYLPFKLLGILSIIMRMMEVALDRYDAIKKITVIDADGKDVSLKNFDIEFNNVSFAYEREQVLRQVSFRIPERSMTALVGRSGCGKTTIVNLMARFWDVQEGEVKVGGVNVKEMTCDSLLKNISIVFQQVYLFHDTILNNIKFGKPDATLEEVVAACRKAGCHDFIMEMEQDYDTLVGEGGSSLSGGEKQRISIARAILKDAPIILLDEATASVDPDNEKHIQAAINALVKDKTLVVIAHRLSTIREADQILVIDDGRIAQRGTHQELIAKEGQYYDFWQRRLHAGSWKISKASSLKEE